MAFEGPQLPPQTIKVINKNSSNLKLILGIIFILALAFIAYSYRAQIISSYHNVVNSTQGLSSYFQPLINPQGTLAQLTAQWNSNTTSAEPNRFTLSFVNPTSQAPLSVTGGLSVKADSDLTLKPQCYLDGKPITTDPTSISLSKSDTAQQASVTCSNTVGGKELDVKIENPASVEAIASVWIGKNGTNQGALKSLPVQGSGYTVSLSTFDQMPFNVTRSYPLFVTIKRTRATAALQSITSLKLSTLSNNMRIECPFGAEFSGDSASLSNYKSTQSSGGYDFMCQLVVTSVPENADQSFIAADMSYVAVEEFKTSLA